jgi:hypothetical protein
MLLMIISVRVWLNLPGRFAEIGLWSLLITFGCVMALIHHFSGSQWDLI